MLDYVKMLYRDDVKEFDMFVEEVKDPELARNLELVNDPSLPEWISQSIYLGLLYDYRYKNPVMVPQVVIPDKERLLIDYDLLTTYLIKRFCIVSYSRINYIYKNNRFVENKGEIERLIEHILLKQGLASKQKIREIASEVNARINWRTFLREYPFNKAKLIPLRNGVLYERRLIPHSPAFGFNYCLPVSYNPDAKAKHIPRFIEGIVGKENKQILYEIPALCLIPQSYQLAFMLVGSGANGKSTYLQLLEHFLGKENIANVSLQDLCEDRFKAAQLVGKLANIYADLPKNPIQYTGKFKLLTGGDRITFERKYKDPFEYENRAILIFSANELPEVTDLSYAFWRRWIIVEFPNRFEVNPDFINSLITEEELSGFLNEVLKAISSIELKGITSTKTVEDKKEEWMKRSNSVYAFVSDCIESEANCYELKDDVYNAYIEYCEDNDLTKLAKNAFAMELQKQVWVKAKRVQIGKERKWVWYGIRLTCKEKDYVDEQQNLNLEL
jgi:putative DNA primase/helicase